MPPADAVANENRRRLQGTDLSKRSDPAILFDEDAADKFEQMSAVNNPQQVDLDGVEDLIDPVTVYRFQENSRRLERLKAELLGQSVVDATKQEEQRQQDSARNSQQSFVNLPEI